MKTKNKFLPIVFLGLIGLSIGGIWSTCSNKSVTSKESSSTAGVGSNEQNNKLTPDTSAQNPSPDTNFRKNPNLAMTPQTGQNSNSEKDRESFVEKFNKTFPGEWRFQFDANGLPFRIMSGKLPINSENEETRSKNLALFSKQISSMAGLIDEISFIQPSKENVASSALSKTYLVKQKYLELEVYQGWIKYTLETKSNAAIMLNLSLVEIDKGASTEIIYNAEQARRLVSDKYRSVDLKFNVTKGPLFYASNSTQEPVWAFYITTQTADELDSREVLVGARSNRIIKDETEMYY